MLLVPCPLVRVLLLIFNASYALYPQQNSTTTGDVFENKMSDVVKGTAKPSTSKPTQSSTTTMSKEATPPPSATPANSTSTSTSQSQVQY